MKKRVMRWLSRFVMGIALFSFVVICNFILFFSYEQKAGFEGNYGIIIIVGNIIFLAILFTIADSVITLLNDVIEELSGVETLRTDFIANVSHELKTPMAVMQNYGTLLQANELPDNTRIEYGKAIAAQTRRLSALVTNILKLNKLENQQIFPNVEVYDIGEQLCECMLEHETVWEEKV